MIVTIKREYVVKAVSVILRVPSLFIAEAWYRTDPKVVQHRHLSKLQNQLHNSLQNQYQDIDKTLECFILAIYYAAILLAVAVAFLPLRKLVTFYMYLVSFLLLAMLHYTSFWYVETEKASPYTGSVFDDTDSIQRLGLHLVVQGIVSAIIAYLINLQQWTKLCLLIYTAPMWARLLNYPVEDLHRVHNFSSIFTILVVVLFVFNRIPQVLDLVTSSFSKVMLAVQIYGTIPFVVAMWFKILLPVQFLTFWLVLFLLQLYKYFSVGNHPIFAEGWVVVILASVGECCVTPFSLMGLCVTVSYVAYFILMVAKLYLQGREAFLNDNVMHRGWTEGFTMFLLALQTGIIDLKSTQRIFLMSIVLFIVLSSLIQSLYEITDPILLALGASHNKSWFKHARAIVLCTFLWMFPLFMTYCICQFFDLDFWLLAVISSCVLTSVQVLGSLVVYSLFLYDTLRTEPWESLDDVVYYAKATTRVLEFIVAVFVVCYGVKESLLGEWSWINSSILIIHCYFNVWQRLQAGWKSYLLRREAAEKIESLPLATKQQLHELDDVCPICFQEMITARVTPCSHIFHAVCLKKWLYVQENCPMCHQKISMQDKDEMERAQNSEQQNENRENDNHNAENDNQNVNPQENIGDDLENVFQDGHVDFDVKQNNLLEETTSQTSVRTGDDGSGDASSLLQNNQNRGIVDSPSNPDTNSSQGTSKDVKAAGDGSSAELVQSGRAAKEMLHMAFMMALFLMLSLTTIYCYIETI